MPTKKEVGIRLIPAYSLDLTTINCVSQSKITHNSTLLQQNLTAYFSICTTDAKGPPGLGKA